MTFHPDSLPDLTGKVYLVTGGNSGIGYYTVARLAEHGAHVYLCARSIERGSTAVTGIQTLYPQAKVTLLQMDHLDLSSVVSAAKEFLSRETVLHGLVNNAGIMATPFELSKDGHEAQWQTNYLAHWVLTSHLLPLMLRTSRTLPRGSVRIVNVSSSGHYFAPKVGINFEDTSLRDANGMTRYGQSKLANALHIKTLHKLYGPGSPSAVSGQGEIWSSIVHPGLVESQLGQHAGFPTFIKVLADLYGKLGGRVNADKGSWTSVFCVASPEMKPEQSGVYFQRIAEIGWQSKQARDSTLAAKLEDWTKAEMEKKGWLK
ncbi:carbonyl reductase, putative [Talaromyces stipitatus ATCC 10500]|uniref:Carbonyl reductase, putative n=1 Tax=Talaromyces stipitatus (strain ATCC 10500 / CBS 375.48 / QM 6759 / NRRL 1006) TaxID=441959 RepID=B8MS82_TALSN|nr:carbonyl reductase, putative [Talaromyces stipitatus ATCC 10500]EED12140.1 carbonyl reductase, putative [Talaromyces stipitatus ATCC 10500]